MGSSLSPKAANLYMESFLLKEALEGDILKRKARLKYVDDVRAVSHMGVIISTHFAALKINTYGDFMYRKPTHDNRYLNADEGVRVMISL